MTYPTPVYPFGNLLTLRGIPYYGVLKIVGYDPINDPDGLLTNLEGSISFKSAGTTDGTIGQWLMGVNLPSASNTFFSIENAAGSGTPFVINPNNNFVGIDNNNPQFNLDVTGNSHTSLVHTVDEEVIINAASGNTSIKNPVAGSGLVMQGYNSGSSYGQLRLISNSTGWADSQTSSYIQIENDQNTNAVFGGGSFGTDTQLTRLQFSSEFTTITDHLYNATPAPTSLLELVASSDKKLLKLVGTAGQTSDYINVLNSSSSVLMKLDSSGNLTVSGNLLVSGTITDNNLPLARFVASAPANSTASGNKGDYFINTTAAYFCIATNTWIKISGVTASF